MEEQTLVIVDDNDNVIGEEKFFTALNNDLNRRGSCVFIFKDESYRELLVQKRSEKVMHPGTYHVVAGHCNAGNSYFETAKAELSEEMFFEMETPELKLEEIHKARLYMPEYKENAFATLYRTIYPGPFNIDTNEVADFEFMDIFEMQENMKKNPEKFSPSFIFLFDEYMKTAVNVQDAVDSDDNVISKITRDEKYHKGHITRNVVVFVKDSDGKFIVVKRAAHKRDFPNCLDLSVCGGVNSGETYEEAALREMKEELNITCEVTFLKKIYQEVDHKDEKLKFFTGIFVGKSDKEVRLNHEVKDLKKYSAEEINSMMKSNPELFSPGFITEFNEVKDLIQKH